MVEEFGPVGRVVGGTKDVHHHEVLDVVMLAAVLQLIDVAAANSLHFLNHGKVNFGFCLRSGHLERFQSRAKLKKSDALNCFFVARWFF